MPDDRLLGTGPVAQPGIADQLATTVRDAGRLVVDHLELAALEMQRAAETLVHVLIASIIVTTLVVAAWMACVAGVAIWMTHAGISLPWALALAGAANLVAALAIAAWIRARLPTLAFAATLRQLRNDKEALTDELDDAS